MLAKQIFKMVAIIKDVHHLAKSYKKDLKNLREGKQNHDFSVYVRVFGYARYSGAARKHPRHHIVGKIQNGLKLSKVKQ